MILNRNVQWVSWQRECVTIVSWQRDAAGSARHDPHDEIHKNVHTRVKRLSGKIQIRTQDFDTMRLSWIFLWLCFTIYINLNISISMLYNDDAGASHPRLFRMLNQWERWKHETISMLCNNIYILYISCLSIAWHHHILSCQKYTCGSISTILAGYCAAWWHDMAQSMTNVVNVNDINNVCSPLCLAKIIQQTSTDCLVTVCLVTSKSNQTSEPLRSEQTRPPSVSSCKSISLTVDSNLIQF